MILIGTLMYRSYGDSDDSKALKAYAQTNLYSRMCARKINHMLALHFFGTFDAKTLPT